MKESNNTCPICDAMGFPAPCKGHGGKAGESSDDTEKSIEKDGANEPKVGGSAAHIMLSLLMQPTSTAASAEVAHISQLPSMVNIDMDALEHTLTFSRNTLSLEVFKLISEHLGASIKDLKEANPHLAKELSGIRFIANDEQIIIEAPSMKAFVILTEHLMQQNLLPGINLPKVVQISRLNNSAQVDVDMAQVYTQTSAEEGFEQSSSAPSPFSMQLTPPGFGDE
jgi:hypothetical protein